MYNCAAVLQNKRLLGVNPKKLLAREGVHYEARWFRPWPLQRNETIDIFGEMVPFGDYCYQIAQLQLGIVICEEAWSAEGGASDTALSSCELIVNLSASHFALGKARVRETLIKEASRSFQAHYLYTNLLGLEAGRMIYDGELILGECGKIRARSERFSFEDGTLLLRDIDLDLARVAKLKNRSVLDSPMNLEQKKIVHGPGLIKANPGESAIDPAYRGCGELLKDGPEWEFLQAEKLGLFDYVRKSKSAGFMVSLSGGCDSSAIVVLCAHMIAEALKSLGPEGLGRRLAWSLPAAQVDDPRSWIRARLCTLYQATQQSGTITRQAARAVAEAVGAEHLELDVDDQVKAYISKAEHLMARSLEWSRDDLALQNIQARSRAPMVWLMANLKNFLLLATSNRSEIAVGYASMDGDTAGGLAPLGGIDKYFLRSWLLWAERENLLGLGKIPALALVNQQEPTAELRPPAAGQKDELDLMPYEILNAIEGAFVRDRMEPESILTALCQRFEGFSAQQLRGFLSRFYQLWSRNQWKRERYATCFHLDDYNLDSSSWCRFPILSAELKI
ncbi:MAG: NAD+ synthetase, partial [Proteobacteria bacterium]|nr:NAD+ synthetase [Pseudomonadota bacterium]